jgi:lysophospholipase L1-like esterase
MPIYYNRSVAEDSGAIWDPAQYSPDTVLVMLGTNDYSTEPVPSDEMFISGLVAFVRQIQTDYPRARVVAICSSGQSGNQCSNIKKSAALMKTEFLYISPDTTTCPELCGCDGHPNAQGQQNLADTIISFLKSIYD